MRFLPVLLLVAGVATAAEPSAVRLACDRPPNARYELKGPFADYLRGVSEQWLKVAPTANPGMLEMFRDRDRKPLRAMEPWAGEFAGKYLTAGTQVYRLTGDAELKATLAAFVKEWVALQADDGYLGPWPNGSRLTGKAPNVGGKGQPGDTWDAWGHYHAMLGLLLWHDTVTDENALKAATRIGDLLCERFLATRRRGW